MWSDGVTSSTRTGRIGCPSETARSTSRRTCGDEFEAAEKTSTKTLEAWIASVIA